MPLYLGNSPDTLQIYSFSIFWDRISSPIVSASFDVLQINMRPDVILSSLLEASGCNISISLFLSNV